MDKPQAQTVENCQMEKSLTQPVEGLQEDPKIQHTLDSTTAEFEDDEFWPLSGKPYFSVSLDKSQLKPLYQLLIPAKMHPLLPSYQVPVVLTYFGKNWEMTYYGDSKFKSFDPPSWKIFAIDNNLKDEDVCLFELAESGSANLKFRVQILRGEFPAEFLERVNGESSNTSTVLD